jgi:hypothetical protein
MFSAYDDVDIGALETEEIEGTLTMESELIKKAAEEFELNMKRVLNLNVEYFLTVSCIDIFFRMKYLQIEQLL